MSPALKHRHAGELQHEHLRGTLADLRDNAILVAWIWCWLVVQSVMDKALSTNAPGLLP